ncbi:hypothetical protein ACSS6W_001698 [Trichoderma asperelloides]|uniref:Box C/D snoRNA protein 1 n=1 Tax=Trichoderma asperellum TaxID=101201 RepID=A0A6V8QPF2_TRIAP|nr:putative box C/D snoRNA protein SPCC613.07 [Trichoderma asperellum]
MADPLLTSLCAICHTSVPQYKCPRCNIRTCSLACVKKHKSWSQCSGERDQTAYVPKSRLATAAGVDHDYNFLHSIEMASERAERVLVEDKGIIQKDELRPLTVEEVRWKVGRDGRKRKVMVTKIMRRSKERLVDKLLASRLRKLGTEVVSLPQGMTRQRENHTTVNRKSGRINWQAEWFTFEKVDGSDANELNKIRTLSKLSDDVPLYKGYSTLLESQAKAQGKVQQKRAFRGIAQNPWDSHWHLAGDCLQDPQTGGWISIRTASIDAWPREDDESQLRRFQFFLESSKKRPDRLITLTPIQPEECLRNILSNTKVIEFPAIYVLEEGEALPAGYVLGPKDIVVHPHEEQQLGGAKRKDGPQQGKRPERPAKRRRPGDKEGLEEGELGSDRGSDEDDGKAKDGAEADDVIAEQSLGEDEDDETTSSDESTSSSESDSE